MKFWLIWCSQRNNPRSTIHIRTTLTNTNNCGKSPCWALKLSISSIRLSVICLQKSLLLSIKVSSSKRKISRRCKLRLKIFLITQGNQSNMMSGEDSSSAKEGQTKKKVAVSMAIQRGYLTVQVLLKKLISTTTRKTISTQSPRLNKLI